MCFSSMLSFGSHANGCNGTRVAHSRFYSIFVRVRPVCVCHTRSNTAATTISEQNILSDNWLIFFVVWIEDKHSIASSTDRLGSRKG